MSKRDITPERLNKIVRSTSLSEKIDAGDKLAFEPSYDIRYSGVVVSLRKMGKVAFGRVLSTFGAIQFMVRANDLGEEKVKEVISNLSLGTHIHINGHPALTGTKEPTLLVFELIVLQDSRSSFPDKWNGVSEDEKRRLRYQDCLVNQDKHKLLTKRAKFIRAIREYLEREDFIEVETPILHKVSAGAQARPFTTHSNAMDNDYYLRIAPETYLKRMTAAGYHRVYEIGKQFRNEGVDPSHMPEFTSCEWYQAYSDSEDQKKSFVNLLDWLYAEGFDLGIDPCDIQDYTFKGLYNAHCPIGLDETPIDQIDANFKQYVRPTLISPCFISDYPEHVAPLAKRNPEKPGYVEMWQFVWKGQEVVKCYSELVDPVEQRKLLEGQAEARNNGDSEAMMLDESFLKTMEFGMPEQAGVGIGIDRLFALFMGIEDIRDAVFFPLGV